MVKKTNYFFYFGSVFPIIIGPNKYFSDHNLKNTHTKEKRLGMPKICNLDGKFLLYCQTG